MFNHPQPYPALTLKKIPYGITVTCHNHSIMAFDQCVNFSDNLPSCHALNGLGQGLWSPVWGYGVWGVR